MFKDKHCGITSFTLKLSWLDSRASKRNWQKRECHSYPRQVYRWETRKNKWPRWQTATIVQSCLRMTIDQSEYRRLHGGGEGGMQWWCTRPGNGGCTVTLPTVHTRTQHYLYKWLSICQLVYICQIRHQKEIKSSDPIMTGRGRKRNFLLAIFNLDILFWCWYCS